MPPKKLTLNIPPILRAPAVDRKELEELGDIALPHGKQKYTVRKDRFKELPADFQRDMSLWIEKTPKEKLAARARAAGVSVAEQREAEKYLHAAERLQRGIDRDPHAREDRDVALMRDRGAVPDMVLADEALLHHAEDCEEWLKEHKRAIAQAKKWRAARGGERKEKKQPKEKKEKEKKERKEKKHKAPRPPLEMDEEPAVDEKHNQGDDHDRRKARLAEAWHKLRNARPIAEHVAEGPTPAFFFEHMDWDNPHWLIGFEGVPGYKVLLNERNLNRITADDIRDWIIKINRIRDVYDDESRNMLDNLLQRLHRRLQQLEKKEEEDEKEAEPPKEREKEPEPQEEDEREPEPPDLSADLPVDNPFQQGDGGEGDEEDDDGFEVVWERKKRPWPPVREEKEEKEGKKSSRGRPLKKKDWSKAGRSTGGGGHHARGSGMEPPQKKRRTQRENPWVQHVRAYARKNNINFAQALNDPTHRGHVRASYYGGTFQSPPDRRDRDMMVLPSTAEMSGGCMRDSDMNGGCMSVEEWQG